MYDGCVYVMASAEAAAKFKVCPTRYVYQPAAMACRVLVVGQPYKSGPEVSAPSIQLPALADMDAEFQAVHDALIGDSWIVPSVAVDVAAKLIATLGSTLTCVLATDPTLSLIEPVCVKHSVRAIMSPVPMSEMTVDSPAQAPVTAALLRACLEQPCAPTASDEPHEVESETTHPSPYAVGPNFGYGEARQYCPVSLKDNGVLRPGLADMAAQYVSTRLPPTPSVICLGVVDYIMS
jgi:hypothetical protein